MQVRLNMAKQASMQVHEWRLYTRASQGGWGRKANLEKKLCDARKAITGIETHT